MYHFSRNLIFLIPFPMVLFLTSAADGGFVSVDSSPERLLSAFSSEAASSASSSHLSDDLEEQLPASIRDFEQKQVGSIPSNGGTTSSSCVQHSGSSAPAGLLNEGTIPSSNLISPHYLLEIPFTPQSLVAEIFRPPCA